MRSRGCGVSSWRPLLSTAARSGFWGVSGLTAREVCERLCVSVHVCLCVAMCCCVRLKQLVDCAHDVLIGTSLEGHK